MTRVLALCIAAILIPVGLHGQSFRPTSVGLFADAEHSVVSVNGPQEFSIYVWYLPGDGGFKSASLELSLPANVELLDVVMNPVFHPLLGCYMSCPGPTAPCCAAPSCEFGWVWSHRVDCRLLDWSPSLIEIVPCPGAPFVKAQACYPAYSFETAIVLNEFGLNRDAIIAVDRSSWGAIKSFYR